MLKKGLKQLGIFLLLLIPFNVVAYSDYIIPGGENIGIEIESDGIIVIGFYKVNGIINKGNPNLKVGDRIIRVNSTLVTNIPEMVTAIEEEIKDNEIKLTFLRNNKEKTTTLNLYENNGVFKTGLYVKDSLTGIGTLTYIDPSTLIFGALGHEVAESTSKEKIEVKTGNIFRSTITSIDKSVAGTPGGKNAKFYYNDKYGSILKNTSVGIFGLYDEALPERKTIEVAEDEEIRKGEAQIFTVLEKDKIDTFNINILKIEGNHRTKNLVFEINDEKLLQKTGGIVQGMSGSPIIQNNKIIGAVTHVFVDDTKMGYGIFITTMLEEGEK